MVSLTINIVVHSPPATTNNIQNTCTDGTTENHLTLHLSKLGQK